MSTRRSNLNRTRNASVTALLCVAMAACQTSTFDSLMVNNNATVGGTVTAGAFSSSSPLNLQTGGTTRIFVNDSTGNVGIGTLTPTRPLHVAGDGQFDGTVFANAFSSNSALELKTAGTTRIFVKASDGNVGIDTNDPMSQLDVRGGIRTSTISGGSITSLTMAAAGATASLSHRVTTGNTTVVNTKVQFAADTTQILGRTGFGREPAGNRLEVEGVASKTVAGVWAANSDARIKSDVQTVDHALETLDRVRLVSFTYNDAYRTEHPSIGAHRYLSVIAQEFRQVFPDHVCESGDKLPSGEPILQVDPWPLTIYSAAAVQELHRKVRDKEAEIESLRARLEALEARLAAIEAK